MTEVGKTRKVIYRDGAVWTLLLTEVSDVDHRVSWDVISVHPETKFTSRSDSITLKKVTHSEGVYRCFLEWETVFRLVLKRYLLILLYIYNLP